jgi:hypothetical protein
MNKKIVFLWGGLFVVSVVYGAAAVDVLPVGNTEESSQVGGQDQSADQVQATQGIPLDMTSSFDPAQLAALFEQTKQANIVLDQLRISEYNPFYNQESVAAYNFKAIPVEGKNKMPHLAGIVSCEKAGRKDKKNKSSRSVVRYTITPQDASNTQQVILVKVVHGTFSNPEVYASKSLDDFGRSIIIFAQQLALAYKTIVYVDIFGWSGKLDRAERLQAGKDLAEDIFDDVSSFVHQSVESIIWALGHSHGCNVIHNAAQTLKDPKYAVSGERVFLDNAVLLASPLFDIDPMKTKDKTYNINSILHFYGNADTTARLGSVQSAIEQIWTGKKKVAEKTSIMHKGHAQSDTEWMRNIRVKCDGMQTDHITIASVVIRFLGDILYGLGKDFPIFYDLVLNMCPAKAGLAWYRPEIAIAQSDRSLEIIKYAPQYVGLMPKNIRESMMQSVQASDRTIKNYAKRYSTKKSKASMYDKGFALGDVVTTWNAVWGIDPLKDILYGK